MQSKKESFIAFVIFVALFVGSIFFTQGGNKNTDINYDETGKATSTLPGSVPILTNPPPEGGGPSPTPPEIIAPVTPTSTPGPQHNTILVRQLIDDDDLCWLSTALDIEVNVRSDYKLSPDNILGVISPNQIYLVKAAIKDDTEDVWYKIALDEHTFGVNEGWVAGIVNDGFVTIVKGRCDRLIDLAAILKDCFIDMSRVQDLPPYILFSFAYSENPCANFQRLLNKMERDRHFGDRIQNIETILRDCPALIFILYSKIRRGESLDFGCPSDTTTQEPPTQSAPPEASVTSTPIQSDPQPTAVSEIPSDVVGVFVLQQNERAETASLRKISPQDLLGQFPLPSTEDNRPKSFPVIDSLGKFIYYISQTSTGNILLKYDISDQSYNPVFQDSVDFALLNAPFAVSNDGTYLLVILKDTNGFNIYKLSTDPEQQDLSQPFLYGFNNVSAVALSADDQYVAIVRGNSEAGHRKIFVQDMNDLALSPYIIGDAGDTELQGDDCFAPAFGTDSVVLYFLCSGNKLYIQHRFSLDAERDLIQFQSAENIGTVEQLIPVSYEFLAIRDERQVYIIQFQTTTVDTAAGLDYSAGTLTLLFPNLAENCLNSGLTSDCLITGIALTKVQ